MNVFSCSLLNVALHQIGRGVPIITWFSTPFKAVIIRPWTLDGQINCQLHWTSSVPVLQLPVWTGLFAGPVALELLQSEAFSNSSTICWYFLLFICWMLSHGAEGVFHPTWFICSEDFIINVFHKMKVNFLYYFLFWTDEVELWIIRSMSAISAVCLSTS